MKYQRLQICRYQIDSFIWGGLCCQCEVGVADSEVSTPLGHTSPYGFSNTLFIIPKHGTRNPTTPSQMCIWPRRTAVTSYSLLCECVWLYFLIRPDLQRHLQSVKEQMLSEIFLLSVHLCCLSLVFRAHNASLLHFMVEGWCENFSLHCFTATKVK